MDNKTKILVLDKVLDRLQDPTHWTKNTLARDLYGNPCLPEKGCCWCLAGAIDLETNNSSKYLFNDLVKTIREIPEYNSLKYNPAIASFVLTSFNDSTNTTHNQVIEVIQTTKTRLSKLT